MQSEVPSQSFVWGVLAPRFQSELTLQRSEIWRRSGLLEEYGGPADGDMYRERELNALIEALCGLLVQGVIREVEDRAGRQSVTTSIDGKIRQREAGQLFEFIETVIQPLNRYLTTELRRKPLSASRLARFALDDRRRIARELKRSEARRLSAKSRFECQSLPG